LAGRLARMRNILVGKPERKTPLGKPTHKWEDNSRIDLRELGWEDVTGCIWLRKGNSGGLL